MRETAEGAREGARRSDQHPRVRERFDRFVEWYERNRSSYREGFGELVKLIDKA
jgi:hypothetical protein